MAQQIKSAILENGGKLLQDEIDRPGKHFNLLARAIIGDPGVRKAYNLAPDGSDVVELHKDDSPANADIIDEFLCRGFINKDSKEVHLYTIPMAEALIRKIGLKNGAQVLVPMGAMFNTITFVGGVPVKRIHSVASKKQKPKTAGKGLLEKHPKGKGRLI